MFHIKNIYAAFFKAFFSVLITRKQLNNEVVSNNYGGRIVKIGGGWH
jgi:hypothetical protein